MSYYYRCNECGKLFDSDEGPSGETYCPECGSDDLVEETGETRRRGKRWERSISPWHVGITTERGLCKREKWKWKGWNSRIFPFASRRPFGACCATRNSTRLSFPWAPTWCRATKGIRRSL